jgi:formylglycine-generating enzyme required for sulfatase activity
MKSMPAIANRSRSLALFVAGAIGLFLPGCAVDESILRPSSSPTTPPPIVTVEPTKLSVQITVEPTASPTVPPITDPGVAALAQSGVTSNRKWKPYSQAVNGIEMVLVPAGCFMMGSNKGNPDDGPVHKVCLSKPFWLDKTEVTNAQYGSAGCTQISSLPDEPRNCVNWFNFKAFCEKLGARLPSEAEWEYAARGPDGLVYPWGNSFVADNAVWKGSHTAPVGSKPAGASWVGALDMSGNLWEWVADGYAPYLSDAQLDPTGPSVSENRVMRGGDWSNTDPDVLRASYRQWFEPSGTGPYSGIRCARSF